MLIRDVKTVNQLFSFKGSNMEKSTFTELAGINGVGHRGIEKSQSCKRGGGGWGATAERGQLLLRLATLLP